MEPRTFRYKVTALVDGVITLDDHVFRFKQGLRDVQVPLVKIRRYGVQVREPGILGLTASELILRTEPSQGRVKIVRMPFDPRSDGGRAALLAMKQVLAAADTTELPWPEAASRLGVPVRAWHEFVMTRWGMMGVLTIAATAGAQSVMNTWSPAKTREEHLARGIVGVVGLIAGITMIIVGGRRSRR
jgi:hypothetical protein